ncbi:MAG: 3-dehydroquinate synthase [Cyclobacteriaceae bacterium]|nr:3-dehydroquinate synthase [Cyclobacteriaceae bacterium]
MIQTKIQAGTLISKSYFKAYSSIAVLVDENTRRHCYDGLIDKLPKHGLIEIKSGEENKTLATAQVIWQKMTDLGLDRHSLLVIIGGGVLGDMGGFCAATFKRGIDFLLVPTTLLSQVDASIGGKLAIDFGSYKNHIGIFQQPVTTHIATDFLKTLSTEELRSGFAEVIKHCIIADKAMWKKISKRSLNTQDWLKLVKHSVKIKSLVVKKDPKEKGLRKILNFGHTIGHALEGYFLTSGKRILHGEAIAIGMVMESYIANRRKLLSSNDLKEITGYILSVYGRIDLPGTEAWIPLLKHDKKNKGNKILMALPKQLGKATWDVVVSAKEIRESLDYYRSF